MRIDMVGVVTLILVFLAWLVFGAIFLFRKKPPKAEETKRVAAAKWGIALQGVGFALVGSFHRAQWWPVKGPDQDRKSTRLNSSHQIISYAVFCLKKNNCT